MGRPDGGADGHRRDPVGRYGAVRRHPQPWPSSSVLSRTSTGSSRPIGARADGHGHDDRARRLRLRRCHSGLPTWRTAHLFGRCGGCSAKAVSDAQMRLRVSRGLNPECLRVPGQVVDAQPPGVHARDPREGRRPTSLTDIASLRFRTKSERCSESCLAPTRLAASLRSRTTCGHVAALQVSRPVARPRRCFSTTLGVTRGSLRPLCNELLRGSGSSLPDRGSRPFRIACSRRSRRRSAPIRCCRSRRDLHFAYPDRTGCGRDGCGIQVPKTGALPLVTDDEIRLRRRIGRGQTYLTRRSSRRLRQRTSAKPPDFRRSTMASVRHDVFLACVYAVYMYTTCCDMRMTQEFNRIDAATPRVRRGDSSECTEAWFASDRAGRRAESRGPRSAERCPPPTRTSTRTRSTRRNT